MTCGIYQIRNVVDGKLYVGQSMNISKRWREHRHALRHGTHANPYLQNAWRHYGEYAFVFSVVAECSVSDLTKAEQDALDRVPPDRRYNLGPCVDSPRRGSRLSSEQRARLRGREVSPETRTRLSRVLSGRCVRENFRPVVSTDEAGVETYFASVSATRDYGFSPSAVCSVCRGKWTRHKGRRWRYAGFDDPTRST